MSFPNQALTIHLENHILPVEDCDFCESWPPVDWSKEDLEKYAEAMDREMALHKQSAVEMSHLLFIFP